MRSSVASPTARFSLSVELNLRKTDPAEMPAPLNRFDETFEESAEWISWKQTANRPLV